MNYSAISIQGNIISSEILEKIRTEDIRFQKAIDFNLNPSASIRDEINLAWSIASSNWNAFKQKRENLNETDTGTTETRRFWMLPLLTVLGYEMTTANAEIINGKSYAISHRSTNRDGFPIHIVGVNQSLDKRPDTGTTRLSPHALVQEYLNNNEHLYGLVTNGRFLRVLRDATRLSRLSYLEFDLQQIMEEGLYVEFALLFRALHATRMPEKIDLGPDSIFEFYHLEAISSGSRIRERLSLAVESSIKELANGLLQHPTNEDLRQRVIEDKISAKNYYLYTLRLVYRILFLLVIEERKLIYPEKRDEELNKKKRIYYDFYSLQRLTKLAEKLVYVDPRKTDLWQSLLTTFALFEDGQYGKELGIDPLGSGLFSPSSLGILNDQLLDNECLLKVLRYLVTFENEKGQRVRVNYADLDVEEFGSVYEGLLEYKPVLTNHVDQPIFSFVKGDDRSSSGSHYTPEELVKPLITHSLDYLIADKLKEQDPEAGLLSLTVCDVACGSGHILLSAARRIGFELAKYRSKEDQPAPTEMRKATRDVIRNCIYGVDLNPLAVELCKVALWLEAHDPGQPMNFLDHHIKCGNAIVGLAHFEELEKGIASEAFKTLPGDDKDIASSFKKRNDLEVKTKGQLSTYEIAKVDEDLKGLQKEFANFSQLPENTPEQIAKKDKLYQELTQGKKWWRLKQLADLQVAQFFIPKTAENKEKLTTHSQYMSYLKTETQILDRGTATAISQDKRFFHWFLEFPQIFQNGGFDCILGNPPFLGGLRISTNYGDQIYNFIRNYFNPIGGTCDLVAYFFRRNFTIIRDSGFMSLISTNSISQGDTREGGLDQIIIKGGKLNHAIKSIKWPGVANLEVSLISICKFGRDISPVLNGEKVGYISSLLDNNEFNFMPELINANKGKSFVGSTVLGKGFILDKKKAGELLNEDIRNKEVILPYLIGNDINNEPNQIPTRYIINFYNWEINKAQSYKNPYKIISELVFPERQKVKREARQKYWWRYGDRAVNLYANINKYEFAICVCRVTKHLCFSVFPKNYVYDVGTNTILLNRLSKFSILHSSLHESWARKYGSSLETRLRYTSEDCFETYPFPNEDNNVDIKLEKLGANFLDYRKQLMIKINLGLTKTYNQLHNKELVGSVEQLSFKQFQKKYGKETWNLYNHLEVKKEGNISYEEAVTLIFKLRELHKEMDEAVLEAYGWQDIKLRHDFYEVEYLPENDRVRYTMHPEARKEVLKRLLLLNHERYEEEIKQGLHKKADVVAFYKQKGKETPEGTTFSDVKTKKRAIKKAKINVVKEPTEQYGLFTEATNEVRENSKVTIQKEDNTNFKYHITKNAVKGNFSGEFKQIATNSTLAENMLGRKVGDAFVFGGVKYKILSIE
ncbi:GreA/GreB family transcription elongation factor [Oceanihabitans sediminis]|uniref:site-specific DNA-methyltransferase (adenine-specific) n=1 Tax=Oceanihabitans sediminis TaxID=1812012 RepID=A0A368P6F5_9FLAO|nr:DNA methyltransferase [Oceanihabitans sediminis]RBP32793.1 GreA/GreB family transcription elongation factor [Oceanihabitans sediminis]RCU57674.1 restriction endonuclease [Oceanihabitans sediminis]